MSKRIHILTPSGEQSEDTPSQVRYRYERGLLDPGAVYWEPGMLGWRPLSELAGTWAKPAEFVQLTLPYNLEAHSRNIRGLLFVYAGLNLAGLVAIVADSHEGFIASAIGLVSLPVYFAIVVSYFVWLFRTSCNVHALGAAGLAFTPKWAIGWYFIPLLNVVKPYECMREIWQVSTDPVRWREVKPDRILMIWWGLWILSGALSMQELRLTIRFPGKVLPLLSSVNCVVSAAVSFAFAKVIAQIQGRQEALLKAEERGAVL